MVTTFKGVKVDNSGELPVYTREVVIAGQPIEISSVDDKLLVRVWSQIHLAEQARVDFSRRYHEILNGGLLNDSELSIWKTDRQAARRCMVECAERNRQVVWSLMRLFDVDCPQIPYFWEDEPA